MELTAIIAYYWFYLQNIPQNFVFLPFAIASLDPDTSSQA